MAAGLLPGERAVLHERAARALAGDPALAAEVAGHWQAAGRPAEELPARVAAAEAAERVFRAPILETSALSLNVYQMAGDGPQAVIASSDLGQGPGALAWLAGDFTGSGLPRSRNPGRAELSRPRSARRCP